MKALLFLPLAAAGVAGYLVADVAHEVLGHGGACLALGGRITLLTSVYFRSQPHSYLVDAAGPLGSLAVGLGLWRYLRRQAGRQPGSFSLVLWCAMGFTLSWFAGILVYECLTNIGDLAFRWPTLALERGWRLLMGLLGLGAYHYLLRPAVRDTWANTPLLAYRASAAPLTLLAVPYAAAGLAACLAAACYQPGRSHAVREAALCVWAAAAPLLLLSRALVAAGQPPAPAQRPGAAFFVGVGVAFLGFCLLLGRGLYARP